MKKYLSIVLFFIAVSGFSQEQFSVFFESNKFELQKAEISKLNTWMEANKEVKIVAINGYTDEDGSVGFNDTLAKKRVSFIFNEIAGKVKIREDFKTRSFGKLHSQVGEKAENRKVTIYYILEKDLAREDEILGIKKAEVAEVKPKPVANYPDKISISNPNGTTSEYMLDVNFMKQVNESKAGEKLKIENLNFQFNTFAIVNESRGKLYELLLVMQNNPTLKIEIQGHICCNPSNKGKLSEERAKAIKNFLVGQGIDKTRVTFKGFGSTQPIYPLPEKSEEERAGNRRVEILILEN
ncbi:outer membrane protein OmpA-like peptidoglycan-associated protein [Flavobacterium arsenatis]|uniref:Outer membrane protein OmpA-like peptidoglycan-associated protein n=1 Tax=Flavobacterium arsenatis TaxID=1484332 RepID=A0ABU1TR38_9FLAO|nr:OmpA family protein [Flavobacterium arsenatis]MDR6968411.1 outer membrane protein OmpA-like peptidoglycan-associated protein [Flavobacterium arsenatis]